MDKDLWQRFRELNPKEEYQEPPNPTPADVLVQEGIRADNKRDTYGAIQCWQEAVSLDPHHSRAHQLLGSTLVGMQRYEEALPHLHDYVAKKPGNPTAHLYLGQAYAGMNLYPEAVQEMDTATRLAPEFVGLWMELANVLMRASRYHEAQIAYEKLLSLQPNNAKFLEGYSQALQALGLATAAENARQQAADIKAEQEAEQRRRRPGLFRRIRFELISMLVFLKSWFTYRDDEPH